MVNIKNYDFYYKLRTLPFVEQVWLFGSRANSLSKDRSDIDIAILCPEASSDNWQQILAIIDEADTLLMIDCIRFDTLEDDRLKREIYETKTILFKRVKNNYRWYEIFLDLGEAIEKLNDVLRIEKKVFFYQEAAIQIFKCSFELFWKLLKKICHDEGFNVDSPRSTLQQAYAIKLIDNEKNWLEMLEDRNLSSHVYKQPIATLICEHCRSYSQVMTKAYSNIKIRFKL